MRNKSFRPLWLFVVLLALTLTGCEDINKTYKNNTPHTMTELRIWVEIKDADGTFPTVEKWYNNHAPTVTPLGGNFFKLTWNVHVPPGKSVHVGATFKECHDICIIRGNLWGISHTAHFSSATMHHRMDADLGLVVDMTNETDRGEIVTVSALQWAVHSEHVALNNLDWEDPVLDLLDWEDLTPDLPLELFPGDVVTFDVPDEVADDSTHALVRWIATSGDGEVEQLPVYELSLDQLHNPDAQPTIEGVSEDTALGNRG